MRPKWGEIAASLFFTLCLLVFLGIFSTAILPSIGLENWRLPFNILIVLYLGFRVHFDILPVLIFIVQFFYGAFSIEGWAIGTFVGVISSIIISYFKDLIHLSSGPATIMVTFVFSLIWAILESIILYFKTYTFAQLGERFLDFLPEAIILSLLSPLIFKILDRIWRGNEKVTLSL